MIFFKPTFFATLLFVFGSLLMSSISSAQLKNELQDIRWGNKSLLLRLANLSGDNGVVGFENVQNDNLRERTVRCYIIKNDNHTHAIVGLELTINIIEKRVVDIAQTSKEVTETDILWSSMESYSSADISQKYVASVR